QGPLHSWCNGDNNICYPCEFLHHGRIVFVPHNTEDYQQVLKTSSLKSLNEATDPAWIMRNVYNISRTVPKRLKPASKTSVPNYVDQPAPHLIVIGHPGE